VHLGAAGQGQIDAADQQLSTLKHEIERIGMVHWRHQGREGRGRLKHRQPLKNLFFDNHTALFASWQALN
jgi:hypothetical protein